MALNQLAEQPDILFGGISTARNKHVRPYTRRQVGRYFGNPEITYTARSSGRKILDLLDSAQREEEGGDPTSKITRAILIDDKADKVREAALELSQNSRYRALMQRYGFTLVAFNPKPGTNLEDLSDGIMDVVSLTSWDKESVNLLLQTLRTKKDLRERKSLQEISQLPMQVKKE